MPVVTISRQFGAAGVPIGKQLAERFGAELLDRAIVAQVAVRSGIPENGARVIRRAHALASGSASRPRSRRARRSRRLASVPYGEQLHGTSMQERLVEVTRLVIEEAAERGNAVIIGRGGAWILGKRPDVLQRPAARLDGRARPLPALARRGDPRGRATGGEARCAICASPLMPRAANTSSVCSVSTGWMLGAMTLPSTPAAWASIGASI